MARIRKIEIKNFRSIKLLSWMPTSGVNCLIGPGDSGKTSILDAVDYCLGARRNLSISDADFFEMNVEEPICITLTIGDLEDGLKNLDTYGHYLRGFLSETGETLDEPEKSAETVLCLQLTVHDDLEPKWELLSDRAAAQGMSRSLSWGDRQRLAPNRLGALSDYNLSWRRGSVLNKLNEETADASAALINAARMARDAFGDDAQKELSETLETVRKTASSLGIEGGADAKALLDAHSVSFSGGTVALHDAKGVPLRNLGVGSTRLLITGLQRAAAENSSLILIDELEYGLEPHRIIRLLASLGAKEEEPPLQAFVTTHSPTVLRELSGNQLYVLRKTEDQSHQAMQVGIEDSAQGTIRSHPEAFLSRKVIVCEGASEVGFLRGLDACFSLNPSYQPLAARGVSLADGGGVTKLVGRGRALVDVDYSVAIFRDDDKQPDAEAEGAFESAGGTVFKWQPDQAIEDAIFLGVSDAAVQNLVSYAIELNDRASVDQWIKSASANALDLASFENAALLGGIGPDIRAIIARASKQKKDPWFKNVSAMEHVGRHIVGPDWQNTQPWFQKVLTDVFSWINNA
ncbi:ATP-binding protein [uncultured Ruegeria sp.]|uniref:ATP-dependent nuclease n=1 Tax=uncultured Ruegeria sp. TaxID=259304 RepID=UPI002626D6FC|nr:ATP-binding protein [uncultured Ruegeria sp.]